MLSKEEVNKIAKLARIELTEQEIEKMRKDLSAVLDYFNLLKKISSEKSDLSGTPIKYLILRKDEAIPQPDGMSEKIIKAAPAKKGNHIKVKAIL